MTRRDQSASELTASTTASVKLGLRKQRSASTDDEDEIAFRKTGIVAIPGERTPLLANRFDSLAKLFSCVSLSPSDANNSTTGGSQR
jgi:hypothetical protein